MRSMSTQQSTPVQCEGIRQVAGTFRGVIGTFNGQSEKTYTCNIYILALTQISQCYQWNYMNK